MGYRQPHQPITLEELDLVARIAANLDVPVEYLEREHEASLEEWRVAATEARAASARRRYETAEARKWKGYALAYGLILGLLVILADSGGAPGVL